MSLIIRPKISLTKGIIPNDSGSGGDGSPGGGQLDDFDPDDFASDDFDT